MRRIRLHSDQLLGTDALIELQGPAAHHLLRVLRRRSGDEVTLFNGDGREHDGRITEIAGRDRCLIQLTSSREPATESPLDLTLIQAVGRGDRMDWALQKSVELGVTRIQPVLSERTEVRLSGQRANKRMAHWHSVVVSACEQSGRVRIPALEPLCALTDVPAMDGLNLFLDPDAEETIDRLSAPGDRPLRLAIGPEGGFSDRDIKGLRQLGFKGLSLGPRVLRTETAGPAVIAILQARWGDMHSERRG
jgi:16S rRNA (uracil1498-N3)-methyltransferase